MQNCKNGDQNENTMKPDRQINVQQDPVLLEKAEAFAARITGRAGIYIKDLTDGREALALSADAAGRDEFESASVIKVPVMIEAFRRIEAGMISADTEVRLSEADKVPSGRLLHYAEECAAGRIAPGELFPESGVLNYMETGRKFTVRELVALMIVISDNTATNLLIDLLGKQQINDTLRELGCTATRLNRKLFEPVPPGAPRRETENQISVREMGSLLEKMYRGELVSADASRKMTAILTNQQLNYKIPFFLPDLPIAHKTGEDAGITNDIALIYGDRPFLLCLAANDTDVPQTERAYQDIARDIARSIYK